MQLQVTPAQYARLIEARDGWPERLSFLWRGPFGRNICAVAYLTGVAGLGEQEDVYRRPTIMDGEFKPEGLYKLSHVYGLPVNEIVSLYEANAGRMFGTKKRSNEVSYRFQRLLDRVKVIPEPTETYVPSEEYVTA